MRWSIYWQYHALALIVLLLAPLQFHALAEAARQSVELGVLDEPLGGAPKIVTEGRAYLNLEVINIVNHPKQAWFVSGESTYVVAIELHPLGLQDRIKWTSAKTITEIGSSGLSGTEQNVTIGSRRVHLPKIQGLAYKPHLKAHILELNRTNDVTPVVSELNSLLATIPNPYTATAATVLSTALSTYDRIVTAWLEKNKEHVRLDGAGFDFIRTPPQAPPTSCRVEGTINPILGNCVYILIGARQFGGVMIDTVWVRDNLKFDIARKQLVFKQAVTFPELSRWNADRDKNPGDIFDLSSYMLFRFDVQPSDFEEEAIWRDVELKNQFSEAKQVPQVRDRKWQALRDRLVTSNYFGLYDIIALRSAWQQFMAAAGECEDWDKFWFSCFKRTEEQIQQAYSSLQPTGIQLSMAEIAEAQKIFTDPERAAAAKINLAGKIQAARVQRALEAAGFQTLDPKGVLGEDTKAVLKSFQLKQGLPPTGAMDIKTLELLNVPRLRELQ